MSLKARLFQIVECDRLNKSQSSENQNVIGQHLTDVKQYRAPPRPENKEIPSAVQLPQ